MSDRLGMISILYNDVDQDTYRGIEVRIGESKTVFNTGDPVKDWESAAKFCDVEQREGRAEAIMLSSSCDHFVMDGDKYKYIEVAGGHEILVRNEK